MRGIELTPDAPVSAVASLAARAEDAGFDAVFASCHYNNRDPFVALDRMAAATEAVSLGPGVANPYDVHPLKLASQVGTLQEVSGGRAFLGLGAGDASTLRNLGVERDRPLRRVLEAMKVAQDVWAGERVDHDGTFVARDAGLNYDVGDVPVYVGAQGPHMLRMAGKHADGVLVNASHERDLSWAADRVAEGRRDRVVDTDLEVAAFASVSVAEDAEEALDAARAPVAFIAAGADEAVLERHGIDAARAREVGDAIEAGEFSAAFDAVSERMLEAFCIAGDPGDVADQLASVGDHVDSVVAASPLGPDRATAIELLADAFDRAGV